MAFTQSAAIEVKRIKGKGRGVFARRLIRRGESIERVPMLVLPAGQSKGGSVVSDYCFAWGRGTVGLAQFDCNAVFGDVMASFPLAGVLTDLFGGLTVSGAFAETDPTQMFAFGNDLAALLKIRGTMPSATGPYTLRVDPAFTN